MPPYGAHNFDLKNRLLGAFGSLGTIKRIILIIVGTIAVALGVVGIFIPVLPTTPFLLLAAACYAASSKRFYRWLTTNRLFGPHLVNYREGRGMSVKVKAGTLTLMWSMMAVSILFFLDSLPMKAALLAIAIAVSVHILMIKTTAGP